MGGRAGRRQAAAAAARRPCSPDPAARPCSPSVVHFSPPPCCAAASALPPLLPGRPPLTQTRRRWDCSTEQHGFCAGYEFPSRSLPLCVQGEPEAGCAGRALLWPLDVPSDQLVDVSVDGRLSSRLRRPGRHPCTAFPGRAHESGPSVPQATDQICYDAHQLGHAQL